jgi:hypothetical protein
VINPVPAPSGQDEFARTPTPPERSTPIIDLTRESEPAIDLGLKWLEKNQGSDGSWGTANNVGISALALIAYMTRGNLPGVEPYGKVMDRGLDFMLKQSKASPSGYLGSSMYEHGLATLALSELWGQTDRDDEVKKALKAAVDVILRSQNRAGGWRYNPRPADADISVTVMQTIALASAKHAGIVVPDTTIKAAIAYVKALRDPRSGGFGYDGPGQAGFARTAAGVFALMTCGEGKSDEAESGLAYLLSYKASKFQAVEYYMYAHYYACLVMHRLEDEKFNTWYTQVRTALLKKQAKDGRWQEDEGPAYGTAMAVIILSVPYNFVPAYQK